MNLWHLTVFIPKMSDCSGQKTGWGGQRVLSRKVRTTVWIPRILQVLQAWQPARGPALRRQRQRISGRLTN